MKPQDVLLQLLDENDYYIRDILENAPEECLWWKPEPQTNCIGVLVWHTARAVDVFLTQHINNLPAEDELWVVNGWADASGYDPRGVGTNGWGMLTGYTAEEAAAIPVMATNILLDYFDAVSRAARQYLEAISDAALEEKAPGYNRKQTNWFWIRHPLFDMTRHVGEMQILRGIWERLP